jgi:predicted signal transduction protein with EAL and GGDEF domain
MQDTAAVERVVSKLASEMLRPYDLFGGAKARVSASLGVSLFPDDAGDAATLMAHADKAMYAAKRAGKNAFCIFSAGNGANPNSVPSADHRAA